MANDSFPITTAQLTGNFMETLFYGMYLVSCIFCARTLLLTGREERWRSVAEIRWFMLGVAISLFWISTFDVAIGLYHNIQAFVLYKGPEGPAGPLSDVRDWVNIARSVNQVVQMIIGDFVLIYRCYIVYARRRFVVLPSLILYLGGVAMAIKLIQAEATLNKAGTTLLAGELQPWWRAFFAITAVQNVLTTGLLIWRIWRVEQRMSKFRPSRAGTYSSAGGQPRLRKVIRTIAESGAAYTVLVFITFVVSTCNHLAIYPTSDATIQATGIAFNVIMARSSSARDEEFTRFERTMAEPGAEHGISAIRFGAKTNVSENIISFRSEISEETAVKRSRESDRSAC